MAKSKTADVKKVKGELQALDAAPSLQVTPAKPVNVLVNFKEVEAYLGLVLERYETMRFTAANYDEVVKAKAAVRSLRTQAEKFEKDTKAAFFNTPKKLFETGMQPIYTLIRSIEDKCDAVIEAEDQKRIDHVNLAITAYIESLSTQYKLADGFKNMFERKKEFYNKTQVEKDTFKDLEAQAVELHKKQKAQGAGLKLISSACTADKRLNQAMYERNFLNGEDIAVVIEEINNETARLRGIDETEEENDEGKSPRIIAIAAAPFEDGEEDGLSAEADSMDFNSDLPERTKTVKIEITYPVDVGDELTKLFDKLRAYNIKTRILK